MKGAHLFIAIIISVVRGSNQIPKQTLTKHLNWIEYHASPAYFEMLDT